MPVNPNKIVICLYVETISEYVIILYDIFDIVI